jgi:hypothetical protein
LDDVEASLNGFFKKLCPGSVAASLRAELKVNGLCLAAIYSYRTLQSYCPASCVGDGGYWIFPIRLYKSILELLFSNKGKVERCSTFLLNLILILVENGI